MSKQLYIARGLRTEDNTTSANIGMNNIVATGNYSSDKIALRYMKANALRTAKARGYDRVAFYSDVRCIEEIDFAKYTHVANAPAYWIRTNNVPRDLKTWNELPAHVRQEEFDYVRQSEEMDEFDTRFFQYKGAWYDAQEFVSTRTLHDSSDLKGWDGYAGDSYFSGVLLRYVGDDQTQVVVGQYFC